MSVPVSAKSRDKRSIVKEGSMRVSILCIVVECATFFQASSYITGHDTPLPTPAPRSPS